MYVCSFCNQAYSNLLCSYVAHLRLCCAGKDATYGVDSVGTVSAALTAFAAIQVRKCRVVLFKPGKYVAHQTNPCPSNPQASGRSLTTWAHVFIYAGCQARLGYQRRDLRWLQGDCPSCRFSVERIIGWTRPDANEEFKS